MRLLVVSPHAAFQPPRGGTGVRIMNTVRELAALGHDVDFFGVDVNGGRAATGLEDVCRRHAVVPLRGRSRWRALAQSLASPRPFPADRFQDGAAKAQLAAWLADERYDLIWVNFPFMMEYVDPALRRSAAVVLDQHEDEELLWQGIQQQGAGLRWAFATWNLWKLRGYQARWVQSLDALLCVSEGEAVHMRRRLPDRVPVWVVPNGVDAETFRPQVRLTQQPRLLFLGSLNVSRNLDALCWFVRAIWPAVRACVPGARLTVAGGHPSAAVERLRSVEGLDLVGPVEDVRPLYRESRALIAPYRFGVGTRLKIPEAMAMGVPVVATRSGAIGLDVAHEEHLLLAEGSDGFRDAVVRVLTEDALAERLRHGARALVEARYAWPRIIGAANTQLEALVARRPRPAPPRDATSVRDPLELPA